jgi:hypothetical protein
MAGRGRIYSVLAELGRILLGLLAFAVFYGAMAAVIFSAGFGAIRLLHPDRFCEAVIAVASFLLCMPALWFALKWGNAIGRRVGVVQPAKPRFFVQVTDEAIISSGENRPTEQVLWRDLTEVAIVNEDAWPIGFQYWLLVGAGDTGAVIHGEAEGAAAMLDAMQARLPGFDNRAVLAAMGSVDGAFRVWRRPETPPATVSILPA